VAKADGSAKWDRRQSGASAPRVLVAGILALGLAVGVTGCGNAKPTASITASGAAPGTSSTASQVPAPTVKRATDGTFFARVKDKQAALEAAKMQRELGLQLGRLGAASGSVQIVALQYGQGEPTEPAGVTYALAPGDVVTVSKTVTLCAVKVVSGQ